MLSTFKGRSRRLRPKAHILYDPLDKPYDGLKVLFGPTKIPYGHIILWQLLVEEDGESFGRFIGP